ncbi:hypothetical protein NOX19_000094 [Klebsiella aerogenes]|nr:hypothetical protein [Klebsiella aerogenes]EKW5854024.1 hypothetical protein [Klebsiella aerogenes]
MNIIKVDNIFIIKNGNHYLAGKYDSEDTAMFSIENISALDLDTVWNYVLGTEDRSHVITTEDITQFLRGDERGNVAT